MQIETSKISAAMILSVLLACRLWAPTVRHHSLLFYFIFLCLRACIDARFLALPKNATRAVETHSTATKKKNKWKKNMKKSRERKSMSNVAAKRDWCVCERARVKCFRMVDTVTDWRKEAKRARICHLDNNFRAFASIYFHFICFFLPSAIKPLYSMSTTIILSRRRHHSFALLGMSWQQQKMERSKCLRARGAKRAVIKLILFAQRIMFSS